jgi:HPt (histidine-containing phosphotransfer) domain-containing protein
MSDPRGLCSLAAVNLEELLIRIEYDRELLCQLLGIFKTEFPRLLDRLQQPVARQDVKKVKVTSHAMKGMRSAISAMQAAVTASRLEEMGRNKQASGLTDTLALFESQLADLLPELDACSEEMRP